MAAAADAVEVLVTVRENVQELARMMSPDGPASVLDVLRYVRRTELARLDDRFYEYLEPGEAEEVAAGVGGVGGVRGHEEGDEDKGVRAMKAYLECPVKEMFGYYAYLQDESPYSTQQGIKGAEFPRVLVVVDDDEGRHFQFSYEKLLGLKPLSKTDIENREQNRDTVVDRTRRLFYVCCSRAMKDLAVVLYCHEVDKGVELLKASELSCAGDIYTLSDV